MDHLHDVATLVAAVGALAAVGVGLYLARALRAIPDALSTIWEVCADTATRANAAEGAVDRLAQHLRDLGVPEADIRTLAHPVEPNGATPSIWPS